MTEPSSGPELAQIPPYALSGARGLDVSHWNGELDWPQLATDGVSWGYVKAWQGGSPDPRWQQNRDQARAAGLLLLPYVFVGAGDTPAQVAGCLEMLGTGEHTLVLDWETSGCPASAVEVWIDGTSGRQKLAYYGIYPPSPVTPKIAALPRILPEYAGAPKLRPWDGLGPQDWKQVWLIWQRSSKGSFAGEAGGFDLDQLAPGVSLERFKAWCATGRW